MFQKHNLCRRQIAHHILGTLHAGIIIIGQNRRVGNGVVIQLCINDNDPDTFCLGFFQRIIHFRIINRVDDQYINPHLDQVIDLFVLFLDIQSRITGI